MQAICGAAKHAGLCAFVKCTAFSSVSWLCPCYPGRHKLSLPVQPCPAGSTPTRCTSCKEPRIGTETTGTTAKGFLINGHRSSRTGSKELTDCFFHFQSVGVPIISFETDVLRRLAMPTCRLYVGNLPKDRAANLAEV